MSAGSGFERLRGTQLYRPGPRVDRPAATGPPWAEPIAALLGARYAFLACRYGDDGYLFRGLQAGVAQGLATGAFGHFDGDHEMSRVEQDMGVFFVSHDPCDAVTVSKLWEGSHDSALLVLRAATFNEQADAYRAAVLAIGDGGLVFRYPLMTAPIAVRDVEYLITTQRLLDSGRIPSPLKPKAVPVGGHSRAELEADLSAELDRLGIVAAKPAPSDEYPRRR